MGTPRSFSRTTAAWRRGSTTLQQVQQQLQGGSAASDQQRRQVIGALATLVQNLESGMNQLNPLTDSFAQFLQAQEAYQVSIDQAERTLVQTIQTALSEMRTFLQGQPCGQSDAERQFTAIQVIFSASVLQFGAVFGTLDTATSAASTALGTLISTLLNFSSSYNAAIAQLQAAAVPQFAGVLEEIHFDTSWATWKALAQSAGEYAMPKRAHL
jgi:exonuclease VII small subunit